MYAIAWVHRHGGADHGEFEYRTRELAQAEADIRNSEDVTVFYSVIRSMECICSEKRLNAIGCMCGK